MLDHFESASATEPFDILSDIEQQTAVEALEDACEKVKPPLHRLESALHPWVTFLIMPLFALANAGVSLSGDLGKIVIQPITLGVALGWCWQTNRCNAYFMAGGPNRPGFSSRESLMEAHSRRGLAGRDRVHHVAFHDGFSVHR